jgi:hypothetical protein
MLSSSTRGLSCDNPRVSLETGLLRRSAPQRNRCAIQSTINKEAHLHAPAIAIGISLLAMACLKARSPAREVNDRDRVPDMEGNAFRLAHDPWPKLR